MEECIFCKIIKGQVPSAKVYEDDLVYAFLDITQVTKGHTLLVPKQHVKDIFEYDQALAGQVFSRIPLIAKALQKAFPEMQGLNILSNNGPVAYQSVFHSHIHLLPRYSKEDGFGLTFTSHADQYDMNTLQAIADQIAKQIQQ